MKKSVTITAAWIGFCGLVLAAIISGIFLIIASSDHKDISKNDKDKIYPDSLQKLAPILFIEPEMIEIPSSKFIFGCNEYEDASPQKEIYLDKFFIGKYEITNEQYGKFLEANPEKTRPNNWHKKEGLNRSKQPVVYVSWYDAIDFCNWLSQITNKKYRLPTEEEWEKAARGKNANIYPWGNSEPNLNIANFNQPYGMPKLVGSYPLNKSQIWGIMDMAGNVSEWCNNDENESVIKGGSWSDNLHYLKGFIRIPTPPNVQTDKIGFRILLEPSEKVYNINIEGF